MSAREWKPGDIGITGGDPGKEPQIFIVRQGPHGLRFVYDDGSTLLRPPREDARPLVVIDPEAREQVERLIGLYVNEEMRRVIEGTRRDRFDIMQAALREFANPKPRIDEPMGLGAVVEGADGRRWVRTTTRTDRAAWDEVTDQSVGLNCWWADVFAVRVLSEGVA